MDGSTLHCNSETHLLGFQLYLTTHIYGIGEGSPDQQFELNTTSADIALWETQSARPP
jgi:hypothetical protein